jgi:hypothetical protein
VCVWGDRKEMKQKARGTSLLAAGARTPTAATETMMI